ncbi:MAG: glycogen/starch/alpha-glucan phosphorylase [Bryobacterales bacterium]|nr:glycogen/starch/alpha-glucan phosphorylase [Bryobacterales bacterium]
MQAVPLNVSPDSVEEIVRRAGYHLRYSLGKQRENAGRCDILSALTLAVRPLLIDGMFETEERYRRAKAKRVYYLSAEFLIGQSLRNNLHNLGVYEAARAAAAEFGQDVEDLADAENDAALGNGGLGRLAACFLESLATHSMPAYGYGINYEFGLFRQEIEDGHQKERPDHWAAHESPWHIERRDEMCMVPLYGRIVDGRDRSGNYNPMWLDWQLILGVPYDVPVVGYGGRTVNTLRLFSARSSDEFNMRIFNSGDYVRAVEMKIYSETISKVLYPADEVPKGRELRLIQEYFLVACALRDILQRFRKEGHAPEQLPDKVALQMNDTHPALAVAALMRHLVDEWDLRWENAWEITQGVCAFTNHTLLPEALEKWPVRLMEHVLPRHLQIIYEINHRFLQGVRRRHAGDDDLARRMSLVEETPEKSIRMAHLAIVGSHSVNGVAALHSELVRTRLVPDFAAYWPDRFQNKTNGVTHRRWLAYANPGLAKLITNVAGDGWLTDFSRVREVERFAGDAGFQEDFRRVKRGNKERLAHLIGDLIGIATDPESLFGGLAKRIHQYKRQLLKVMYVIHQYLRIVEDGYEPPVPRSFILAGKAAPGYHLAKLIILLIHRVGETIRADARASRWLRVAFLPDYRVSLAEKMIPGVDLSEQISTAGMEASGTGNMKFAMNGALTIGTLDGANVEIRQEVGAENIFIFGLTAEQVAAAREKPDPWRFYDSSEAARRVMDAIAGDRFNRREPGVFRPIWSSILEQGDFYCHLNDLDAYVAEQRAVEEEFLRPAVWTRKAILNVARMGKFSSDRTVAEYARDIWRIAPVKQ